jgi:hypothetical protein
MNVNEQTLLALGTILIFPALFGLASLILERKQNKEVEEALKRAEEDCCCHECCGCQGCVERECDCCECECKAHCECGCECECHDEAECTCKREEECGCCGKPLSECQCNCSCHKH